MWTTRQLDFKYVYGFLRFGGPDGWILKMFVDFKDLDDPTVGFYGFVWIQPARRLDLNDLKHLEMERKFQIKKLIEKSQIMFATCVGAGYTDLNNFINESEMYYDVAIIDESAQALESACFIPILLSKK